MHKDEAMWLANQEPSLPEDLNAAEFGERTARSVQYFFIHEIYVNSLERSEQCSHSSWNTVKSLIKT